MLNHEWEKQIETYLDEKMKESEKKLFEKKIADNDLLRQEVEIGRIARSAIQTEGQIALKKHFQDLDKLDNPQESNENRSLADYWKPIALCCLLAVLGFWFWNKYQKKHL